MVRVASGNRIDARAHAEMRRWLSLSNMAGDRVASNVEPKGDYGFHVVLTEGDDVCAVFFDRALDALRHADGVVVQLAADFQEVFFEWEREPDYGKGQCFEAHGVKVMIVLCPKN